MVRFVRQIAATILLPGAVACSRDVAGTFASDDPPSQVPAGMVVSNSRVSIRTSSVTVSSAQRSGEGVSYVSAASGTFPGLVSVAIRNKSRKGGSVSAQPIDGGFDPVAVAAEDGDALEVTLGFSADGPTILMVRVTPRKPPTVVRTTPAKGRTDVALNVQIGVVFSEPIDRSTVTTSSVRLVHNGSAIDGGVQLSDDALSATLTPTSLLEAGETYELIVTQALKDLDGDALGEPSTSTFTTRTLVSPGGNLRLEAVSATHLEGTVSESVNPVPTVKVNDASGRPISGIPVTFRPIYESECRFVLNKTCALFANLVNRIIVKDSLRSRVVMTDSLGVASPGDWMLGTWASEHVLEASIQDAHFSDADQADGRTVAFIADAKAGAPAAFNASASYCGHPEIGDTVALPRDECALSSSARDRFGNYVSGLPITFSVASGGGSVSTDGRWTLGSDPGINSVVASAPGLNSVTVRVRALDAGTITWYDSPGPAPYLVQGSVGLGENGVFVLVTVETSDAFPGEFGPIRQLGTYTLSENKIAVTYFMGAPEQATLVNDIVTLAHTPRGSGQVNWTFIRRK